MALLQVATHELPLQVWLVPQVAQLAPPAPHAADIVLSWQTLPWQQPLGQLVEVQPATHCWLTHEPVPQLEQAFPLPPHAVLLLPSTHTLF